MFLYAALWLVSIAGDGSSSDAASRLTHPAAAVLRAQVEAWNRGDLEAFMEGYWRSPDLTFYSGGTARKGYDDVLSRYRARYQSEGKEMGRLTFSELAVQPMGRRAALVRGRWRLDFKDGSQAGGLFTLATRRFKGGWKITHDHTSVEEGKK